MAWTYLELGIVSASISPYTSGNSVRKAHDRISRKDKLIFKLVEFDEFRK